MDLQFDFVAEDFGYSDWSNFDPSDDTKGWVADVKFTSLDLIDGIIDNSIKEELEAYFLDKFNKCEHTIGLVDYLIYPR